MSIIFNKSVKKKSPGRVSFRVERLLIATYEAIQTGKASWDQWTCFSWDRLRSCTMKGILWFYKFTMWFLKKPDQCSEILVVSLSFITSP